VPKRKTKKQNKKMWSISFDDERRGEERIIVGEKEGNDVG